MLTHRAGKNIHQHVYSKNPRRGHGLKISDPDVLIRFQSNALAVRRQTGWTTTEDTYTPGWDYRRLEEALTFSIDWATSYMNMKSAALQVWRQGSWDATQDTFTPNFAYKQMEESLAFAIDWASSYMNFTSSQLQVWRQGTQDVTQDTFTQGFGYRSLEE